MDRKKEAARTIKRIVLKKKAQEYYKSWSEDNYKGIKSGKMPIAAQSLFRRMRTYPIKLNTPIYRGVRNQALRGKLNSPNGLANSFSSFTRANNVAKRFAMYGNSPGFVMVLKPGRVSGINSRIFGGSWEEEVTLPPGKYYRDFSKAITYNKQKIAMVPVIFKPSNRIMYINYN
jgi:hypothetical protein